MTLHDIIEVISNTLYKGNGTLILHGSLTQHPKFKVYKVFKYTLYHRINGENKQLLTATYNANISLMDDKLNAVWEEHNKLFLGEVIKYIANGDKNE